MSSVFGSNVPFHCTASGKTFMASLPPKVRRSFVEGIDLSRQTTQTHTTPASLLEDLAVVAKRGFALDQEEFIDGMVAIAVPVRDPAGRFVAALAFHGPVQRMTIKSAMARKDVLTDGARRLTNVLFTD